MSDTTNDPSELSSILEELHRHLVWQQDTGLTVLLTGGQPIPSEGQQAVGSPENRPAVAPSGGRPASSLGATFRARLGGLAPPTQAEGRPAPPDPGQEANRSFTQEPAPAHVAAPAAGTGDGPPAERTLDEIRRELGDCQRCKLCKGRKNIVFGVGNPRAQLVFVGEGPGEQEDLQGIPFVGKAGELLTKMIEAMGFTRDEVYICNVVKCRPPGNRNPEPDEIESCEPFLQAQLAAIKPKVIVALGKFAAQTLLREETAISRLRGIWREYCGIQLMPTFHPAYLLRSPAEKKLVWADLQQVMKCFGKEPPGKGER